MIGRRGAFIIEMVRRDFSERFAGSVLGALWVFIWPLVNLFVYLVIFGKLMGARLPGTSALNAYGIYLACGLIPWSCFANTLGRTTSVFLDRKHIISKVNTSLPSLLIFVNLSEIVTWLISMLILTIYLAASGYDFRPRLLLIPFIFYLQQVLAFALGVLTATLTVFIRDIKEVVGVILQLWFWFTPIVYLAGILPEKVQLLLAVNPVCPIIEGYHQLFVYQRWPDFNKLAILAGATHIFLILVYRIFRALEKDIRDFL